MNVSLQLILSVLLIVSIPDSSIQRLSTFLKIPRSITPIRYPLDTLSSYAEKSIRPPYNLYGLLLTVLAPVWFA